MFEKTPQAQTPLAQSMALFPMSGGKVAQGSKIIRAVNRYGRIVALLPILIRRVPQRKKRPPLPFRLN
jgi:hypothetical protein